MGEILTAASVRCHHPSGGYVNDRQGRKKVLQVVVGSTNKSKWQCNASANSSNSPLSVKNDTKALSTFSSKTATDLPLYEPPGVTFDEYLIDRARVFQAIFPDKKRSERLNEDPKTGKLVGIGRRVGCLYLLESLVIHEEEEWRIQMLPIQFLFLTVSPIVDMTIKCKTDCKDYPPGVPRDITKVLELDITRWELQGLDRAFQPTEFILSVRGALYPVRRGIRSRLKGQLEMSISFVLPPVVSVVPQDVLSGVAESVLNRLVENMKQKVNESLVADFNEFKREKRLQA